jgi:hypothetical protein
MDRAVGRVALAAAASFLIGLLPIDVASADTIQLLNQNFDGMNNAGIAAVPAGWRVERLSTVRALGAYTSAGTLTTASGGTNLPTNASQGSYNFFLNDITIADGTENAVGFLSSGTTGTQSGNLYTKLTNTGGTGITSLNINYDVEKYRNGTNAAGFRFELFYSSTGAINSWTSAGSTFVTAFTADANNNGFSSAPGTTINVSNTLNVPIAAGDSLYLAWNYSVASGNTVTNAQALAIDNVSIIGNTPSQAESVPLPLPAMAGLALMSTFWSGRPRRRTNVLA